MGTVIYDRQKTLRRAILQKPPSRLGKALRELLAQPIAMFVGQDASDLATLVEGSGSISIRLANRQELRYSVLTGSKLSPMTFSSSPSAAFATISPNNSSSDNKSPTLDMREGTPRFNNAILATRERVVLIAMSITRYECF